MISLAIKWIAMLELIFGIALVVIWIVFLVASVSLYRYHKRRSNDYTTIP